MKKILFRLVILIIVSLFLVSGCAKQHIQEKTVSEKATQTEEVKEEKGFLRDKLTFQEEAMTGEVIKNKLTKTAEVKIEIVISDDVEYTEISGEQVSAVPTIVNMMCKFFGLAFFNQTVLEELTEGGNMTAESGKNFLEGYKVDKAAINFIDKEDKKPIADCTAAGIGWENIKFNAYKTYENSLYGMQIGKIMEEVEQEQIKEAESVEEMRHDSKDLKEENIKIRDSNS